MRSRRRGRDRAVVDDPAALRHLGLHQAEGLLRAEEGAREVRAENGVPLLEAQFLHWYGRQAHAGIVDQKVETAIAARDGVEEATD